MSYRNIYMLQHFVYLQKKKESRLFASTMDSVDVSQVTAKEHGLNVKKRQSTVI